MSTKAEDYNQKIISKGSWITKEFLEPIIKGKKNMNDIIIEDINVSAAVGAGGNYLSVIYRTSVNYRRSKNANIETCHLIIKGPPTNECMLKAIENGGMFYRETNMYNNCLPIMRKIQEECFGDCPFPAPDSYPCSTRNTIIMEDLKMSGYMLVNRVEQLGYDDCVASVKTVARFHALSVIFQQRQPDMIKVVSERTKPKTDPDNLSNMFESNIPVFLEQFPGVPGFEEIYKKLEIFSKHVHEKCMEIMKQDDGQFNVLNHGDLWTNNMLFKYNEEGKVEDIKLIDFQGPRYTSPALDLYEFFFTSARPDVLRTKWNELIGVYHKALTSDLKQLNVDDKDIITMDELKEHLKRKSYLAFYTVSTLLSTTTADPEDSVDMDTITVEDFKTPADNPFFKLFRCKNFIETAVKYFKILEELGLLDEALKTTQFVDDKHAV